MAFVGRKMSQIGGTVWMSVSLVGCAAFFLLFAVAVNGVDLPPPPPAGPPKCEPKVISIPECRHFYNYTGMPNLVGQHNQIEAAHQLQTFNPLVSYKCSVKLQFFLCSVYTPICDPETRHLVGPCRPLCEHVRNRCLPVLRAFNVEWPVNLNCSRFPERNTQDRMCMAGPPLSEEEPAWPAGVRLPPARVSKRPPSRMALSKCGRLKNWEKYVYINRTGMCALRCSEHDLFNADDKYIAEVWMGVLSGLCFVSTLITVLTFLIDSQRFKYPERPVIFLAMCYNIYSISYFVRLIAGRRAIVCDQDAASGEQILIQEGLDNTDCAITFLIHYFFGTASSVWWVMLTVTWVLAAGLKWGDEAIQRRSCYLHVTAWLIPSILTVVVLVMRAVDADELLGMCSVGQQRSGTLLAFVIVPNIIFLLLGCLFLFAGFMALLRIRRHVKSDGIKTDKLEVLMGRISLFSLLYIVPAACVTGCNVYEYVNRNAWHRPHSKQGPDIEVFMLKTFMSLVVGMTSGVWIWSMKTLQSWRQFFLRSSSARRRGGPGTLTKERATMLPPVGSGPALPLPQPPHSTTNASGGVPGGPYYTAQGNAAQQHNYHLHQPPSQQSYFIPHYDVKYSKGGLNPNETVI